MTLAEVLSIALFLLFGTLVWIRRRDDADRIREEGRRLLERYEERR